MAQSRIEGIRIAGVVSVLPTASKGLSELADLWGTETANRIADATGVKSRRIAFPGQTASDLCYISAIELMDKLGWAAEDIDGIVFLTQTPDYILPATACILQHKLGLRTDTFAFDVNLGCSGYPYGLWISCSLMKSLKTSKVLLLVGDTPSKFVSSSDRSTEPLFGDAGTATALISDVNAEPIFFVMGTDGSGEKNLIISQGGYRTAGIQNTELNTSEDSGTDKGKFLYMNGMEIFSFTLNSVPRLVEDTLKFSNKTKDQIDIFVFHQANYQMVSHLLNKIQIPKEKAPYSLDLYGNTSCASIPITLGACHSQRIQIQETQAMLVGFGVGYSWSACIGKFSKFYCPPPIFVNEKGIIVDR
jgi:3-oxoacyl-[acyl-carrier-protein] synthase-3